MHIALLPLNALRAFEAAARHLSFAKAAQELHVTPGAMSHLVRGLEAQLGVKLFERRVRSIALTPAGKLLYPGLQTGFGHIREAVAGIRAAGEGNVLVVSTPPGFTARWLAPRLYRFAVENPELDVRVSSGVTRANFVSDGVDVAVRNMPERHVAVDGLASERLEGLTLMPVCSPRVAATIAGLGTREAMARVPLIHDESLAGLAEVPGWADWMKAAGIMGLEINRGLRFNTADHALEAAVEGAGMLLAHSILAADDLRTGRLVSPFGPRLETGRAYHLVCLERRAGDAKIARFRAWIMGELRQTRGGTDSPSGRRETARRGRRARGS